MSERVRCPGSGAPALNVGRGFVGNRLAMVGDCPDCKRRPEVTREWTVKYHANPHRPDLGANEGEADE